MITRRAIAWVVFISCPSIILAGYLIYKIKEMLVNNGIMIDNTIYSLILFLVMWAAMWLTSGKILKAIFSKRPEDHAK